MPKKTKAEKGFGRSLIKDRFGRSNRRTVDNGTMVNMIILGKSKFSCVFYRFTSPSSQIHTTELQDGYDWGRLNLQSVTEESSFHEFLRTAELAGTEFQAEKLNIQFVNPRSNVGVLTASEKLEQERRYTDAKDMLTIPRRPKWTTETSAADLQRMENESFLEWRRGLAALQEDEKIVMTPYERNLAFWRQLWRVVERSDVVCQIVDARNPLLFRSEDLEKYVKEVGETKLNMILINKADFLTDKQRELWAKHFDKENIKVVFFSALQCQEELKRIAEEEREKEEGEEEDSEDESEEDDEEDNEKNKRTVDELKTDSQQIIEGLDKIESVLDKIDELVKKEDTATSEETSEGMNNSPKILSGDELIQVFKEVYAGETITKGITTIGLVGYPNVGKSSTINALLTEKKTSVSATPGKTKHFQTLYLDTDLLLCDCPGLVMPSFVLTKAEMILNGILPIDQMRDHVPPTNQLCIYIPRHILEDRYGIMIPKPMEEEDQNRPPHSEELLLAYGYNRGYMTANGQPDQARAARYILKDLVNGKLLFAYAPPEIAQEEFHTFPEREVQPSTTRVLPPREQRATRVVSTTKASTELDTEFFKTNSRGVHSKGMANMPHVRPPGAAGGSGVEDISTGIHGVHMSNPWKKNKREKKEKLRKKFQHLDQH